MFGVGLGLRVCYTSGYFYLVFIAVWIGICVCFRFCWVLIGWLGLLLVVMSDSAIVLDCGL